MLRTINMTLLNKRKHEENFIDSEDDSQGSEIDSQDEEQMEVGKFVLAKPESTDAPKAKKPKNDLYKQPTVEELNQLRETENLFNSNLFRLQIEEMLSEVKLKSKYVKLFTTWYEEFSSVIGSLKDKKNEYEISDLSWLESMNVKFPISVDSRESKGVFKFYKPASVNIVGSYNLNVALGSVVNIDISVEMPKKMFQKMDYLNQRYHKKRAMYLCHIANKLQKSKIIEKLEFFHKGDILKPLLKVTPLGNLSKHISIIVHLTCEEDSFKLNRFNPSKSNVRKNWFTGDGSEDSEAGEATPRYNFSILQDLARSENEALRLSVFDKNQNLKDGLILLNIWLKQRQFDASCRGFTGYIMSMYMVYLVKQRKLNNAMSSYQIIRNVWNSLANSMLHEHGISLYSGELKENQPSLLEFDSNYDVVLVDGTGHMNICSQLLLDVYLRVKSESEKAVKLLDNANINGFQALFMNPMPFYRQCDHIVQINRKALQSLISKHTSEKSKLDLVDDSYTLGLGVIMDILRKGLGNRVTAIIPKLEAQQIWDVNADCKKNKNNVCIGFILNPEEALNVLLKGPGANLPEAEEFRKFWGSKSELRRFQDGSISEACVWGKSTDTMSARRNITRDIVLYLLQNNLSIQAEHIKYISNQIESILKLLSVKPQSFEYGTGEEATMKVIQAFDSLSKDLRNLKDLALEITALQGISSVFRFTNCFPALGLHHKSGSNKLTKQDENLPNILLQDTNPCPNMCPIYTPANEAVLQLGLSGKWPENLQALRRLKAAFYIQIANGLTKTCQISASANPLYLDVFKDGFVFRLRVVHQKEIGLMKQQIGIDGVVKYRDTEESLWMERELVMMPKLTSALLGLHHQHSAYGPAVCLAKRWLSSQLLDDSHISEKIIELLMAGLFLNPEPYDVPVQPQIAFIRFLNLIAYTDWTTTPLIINFNSEMTKEQLLETETNFTVNRSTLPPLYIVTPYDTNKSTWTKISPSIQVLVRMALLGRQSLEVVENIYNTETSLDFKVMFTPSIEGYDLIINLKVLQLPRRFYSLKNYTFENKDNEEQLQKELMEYVKTDKEKIPITNYDPVQFYLKELRESYDEFALFFHDTYGGDFIAVLWKPQAFEKKEFKVSHLNGRKIVTVDGKPMLVSNLGAIIEDFYILGQGLVKSIENLTNKEAE